MSPVNIFRPRGFQGGFDHRFVKPFQKGTQAGTIDPNASVIEAHADKLTIKPHARAVSGRLRMNAEHDAGRIIAHAYGENLEVYKLG